MQKYRRQIAYLYAYEHGEQLCTAGFVKAEERAGQCRIAVYLFLPEKPGSLHSAG